MANVSVSKFIEKVKEIQQENPKYEHGYYGNKGLCDCVGQVIGGIRRAGGTWNGTHGSNYAARNEMESMRAVTGKHMQVEVGEAVYRRYIKDTPGWKLPPAYAGHKDQNDYYHVGVIVSVNPMVIYDCTRDGAKIDGIRVDGNLAAWHTVGRLKKIDYDGSASVPGRGGQMTENPDFAQATNTAIVVATSGKTVRMRSGPSEQAKVLRDIPLGEMVTIYNATSEWSAISDQAGNQGYMMSKFLQVGAGAVQGTGDVTMTLSRPTAELLHSILGDALRR